MQTLCAGVQGEVGREIINMCAPLNYNYTLCDTAW